MALPTRLLQIVAVVVIGLLLVLLGWQVLNRNQGRNIVAAVEAGDTPAAPDFDLPTLNGDGDLALSSMRGKAVVLNFWASWCEPCKDEAPELQAAWERYQDDGVVVVGLDAQDFRSDARGFIDRFGLTYPNVHDGQGSTLDRFGVTGFPETWFIDENGRIVEHISGPVTAATLEENIQEMLGST